MTDRNHERRIDELEIIFNRAIQGGCEIAFAAYLSAEVADRIARGLATDCDAYRALIRGAK